MSERGRRIDVHAHLVPRWLPEHGSAGDDRWPQLVVDGDEGRIVAGGRVFRTVGAGYWSVPGRIEALDELAIDLQVLSPLPVFLPYWAEAGMAASWCRSVNESIAGAVAEGAGRFLGLGILPMQDVDAAAVELEHVQALGLVGVQLGTAVDDIRTLADPSVDGFLAHLATEDVAVLVHPVRRGLLGPLAPQLEAGVGLPVDTTAALLPRLWPPGRDAPMPRSCVVHGGGTLPWAWPRLASLRGDGPADFPAWCHVDTAAADRLQIEYLVARVGAGAVLFGTDCPAAAHRSVAQQLLVLDEMGAVGARIAGSNAERFLGLAEGTPS